MFRVRHTLLTQNGAFLGPKSHRFAIFMPKNGPRDPGFGVRGAHLALSVWAALLARQPEEGLVVRLRPPPNPSKSNLGEYL